jgi:hypothetical protein
MITDKGCEALAQHIGHLKQLEALQINFSK